jgi:hypothetical protein
MQHAHWPLHETRLTLSVGWTASGLMGGHSAAPSVALPMPTTSSSALAPDVARRIIRRHAAEVTYCYAQALANAPGYATMFTIEVEVSTTGSVIRSTTTLENAASLASDAERAAIAAMGPCVDARVTSWTFPTIARTSRIHYTGSFTVR